MELSGRVALVTGAGRRVGRALASALAARGAAVAIHYHASGDGADQLERQIRADGGDAACFQADLRDAAAARELPEQVAAHFGRLDVLVNSAAVMRRLDLAATSPDDWNDIIDLNLRSLFFTAQGAAPHLRSARGAIVNIADLAGLEPWPAYAAHSVSKAGVVMLTQVLARELAPEVTVNAIAPGAVLVPDDYDAEQREALAASTPLRRLGDPQDVVDALLFLVERGGYVTGHTLVVDGGRTLR